MPGSLNNTFAPQAVLSQPAPVRSPSRPDVNFQTYPYQRVQQCLDQDAYFNLYSVPSVLAPDSNGTLPSDPEDWFGLDGGYGLDIASSLHPFDSTSHLLADSPWLCLEPRLGERIGSFHSKWFFGTEATTWNVQREPPLAIFDPWRSQPFALRDCRFALGGEETGLTGYGLGRTFPLPIGSGWQLACCATGNLPSGFGRMTGLQGTFSLQGRITREFGFLGHVSVRVVDPQRRLELRVAQTVGYLDSYTQDRLLKEDGATYIVMRGEKADATVRTEYGPPPENEALVDLVTPAIMKSVRFPIASRSASVSSRTEIGAQIANLTANVVLDILASPGTADLPNDFQTTDVYSFRGLLKQNIGSVTCFVELGKSFGLQFASLPGQAAMRYGGYGRITGATGIFKGVKGTVNLNAAIGIAPHAISILNVIRVLDPDRRFQEVTSDRCWDFQASSRESFRI